MLKISPVIICQLPHPSDYLKRRISGIPYSQSRPGLKSIPRQLTFGDHRMTALYNLFQNIHPLPDAFWADLQSMVTEKDLPRKTLLLKQGTVCKEISIIIKGLVRAFYFKNDTDITSRFMRENELITPRSAVSSNNFPVTKTSS
jgi:hypothetical protein